MKYERARRRILYCAAVLSWTGVGHFITMMIKQDTRLALMWFVLALSVAMMLTTASLLALFIMPLESVYRSGYEAGKRGSGCTMYRPMLTAVGDRSTTAEPATVTSIRYRRDL